MWNSGGGTPGFVVKNGDSGWGCRVDVSGSLWRYNGTAADGSWQRITRSGNSEFGVFAVDLGNPDRIFAADLAPSTGPEMVITSDAGATWPNLPQLDDLMTGSGTVE